MTINLINLLLLLISIISVYYYTQVYKKNENENFKNNNKNWRDIYGRPSSKYDLPNTAYISVISSSNELAVFYDKGSKLNRFEVDIKGKRIGFSNWGATIKYFTCPFNVSENDRLMFYHRSNRRYGATWWAGHIYLNKKFYPTNKENFKIVAIEVQKNGGRKGKSKLDYRPFVRTTLDNSKFLPTFKRLGCYKDAGWRALPHRFRKDKYGTDKRFSFENCGELARKSNLRYFGLQYGGQCFAGNDYNRAIRLGRRPESYCSTKSFPNEEYECTTIRSGLTFKNYRGYIRRNIGSHGSERDKDKRACYACRDWGPCKGWSREINVKLESRYIQKLEHETIDIRNVYKINKCTYGYHNADANSIRNYTAKLNSLIKNGRIFMTGGVNKYLGDPEPGRLKKIHVWYTSYNRNPGIIKLFYGNNNIQWKSNSNKRSAKKGFSIPPARRWKTAGNGWTNDIHDNQEVANIRYMWSGRKVSNVRNLWRRGAPQYGSGKFVDNTYFISPLIGGADKYRGNNLWNRWIQYEFNIEYNPLQVYCPDPSFTEHNPSGCKDATTKERCISTNIKGYLPKMNKCKTKLTKKMYNINNWDNINFFSTVSRLYSALQIFKQKTEQRKMKLCNSNNKEMLGEIVLTGNKPSKLTDTQAKWYLNKYRDLKRAFKNNITLAKNHWITDGIKENRKWLPLLKVKGKTDKEKDNYACEKCINNKECQFWVRDINNDTLLLKKNYRGSRNSKTKKSQFRAKNLDVTPDITILIKNIKNLINKITLECCQMINNLDDPDDTNNMSSSEYLKTCHNAIQLSLKKPDWKGSDKLIELVNRAIISSSDHLFLKGTNPNKLLKQNLEKNLINFIKLSNMIIVKVNYLFNSCNCTEGDVKCSPC